MRTILIVGAGFSGVACAIQLLRSAGQQPVRVMLLNRGGRLARGMAYGTQSPQHVLNVVAAKMSVLPDDANHFLHYANARESRVTGDSFVARSVYGDYLEWALHQAHAQSSRTATLDCISGNVCSLQSMAQGRLSATLDDGRCIEADQVVLAIGHLPPPPPALARGALVDCARYVADPWQRGLMSAIDVHEPVLLLGTGLTAVDIALQLLRRHPAQQVHALSRHGLLPRPYAPPSTQSPGVMLQREETTTVRGALRALQQQVAHLQAVGLGWHEALATLRHQTAGIWQSWTASERRRFLRHLRPYWEVHRHQLPPPVQQEVTAALARGALQVTAGRMLDIRDEAERTVLIVQPRSVQTCIALRAARIINCTGSCASPQDAAIPLVRQLLADGMMRADPLGLGVETGADCALLGEDGQPTPGLYYIGPWLRAKFWEATAVPELRQFAASIARACLAS
ncbi:FAD-dependent oxidoreductase [Pseudoduganella sp. DS3]|uniref:FAD-dependent oxidoreductase n=1 Tax=Pseudoduganella guangdongensis TaxID=2692179 RepID=A0A6N9HL23_9BURK|nr:FAD/NAD(P)-binding protein [Pseudoduganella guangdongensis]MYN04039.1 FAD-dependent oxidoreductase [Pseudoduganella guangdongensis]